MIHTVKGFGIVNKAEVYVFLELSYFFVGPTDVGNLISGSSAFDSSVSKESTCNAGDLGSIPGWEDPLEKGKATHSSILAWRIQWTV